MKRIIPIIFCLASVCVFVPGGYAQSGIISSYAGPPIPVDGALATQAVGFPGSIISDNAGGFYVTNKAQVYRVATDGVMRLVAGSGVPGFSGDGGPAIYAQLTPSGIAADLSGNLFIANSPDNRIRKVDASGVITTLAGTGAAGFSGDGGQATLATLKSPGAIFVDGAGNLYIADYGNRRIRKITSNGVISTVAGNGNSPAGGDGGLATQAAVEPLDVALDGTGNLFILEIARVRKVTLDGKINSVAGTGVQGYNGDGIAANVAQIAAAAGIALDAAGNLYIADHGNNRVRKVTLDGMISTVAGNGTGGFSGDGGLATLASLRGPNSVAVGGVGNFYFVDGAGIGLVDGSNSRVREVTADGVIHTVAGDGTTGSIGDGGPAALASLANPTALTIDGAGNLLISDYYNYRVRKITPQGVIGTVAGNGIGGYNGEGFLATASTINHPAATAVDNAGNLFIADLGNSRIRKVTPGGAISTVAGNGSIGVGGDGGQATSASLAAPAGVAVDASGNIFIADSNNHRVRKVNSAGVISTLTGVQGPLGLAVDGSGNLFIADTDSSTIRKVTPGGVSSTVAGTPLVSGFSGDGGLAKSATLSGPSGVVVDADGSIFIADKNNNRVRKVTPDGIITTVAGNGIAGFSGDGGSATAASLAGPTGVALDISGNLYIADFLDSRIRKVNLDVDAVLSTATLRADFNGDGKSDILWQKADGSAAIWLMDGISVVSGGGLIGPGTGWRVLKVADLNGDGKGDVVWQHTDGRAAIWLMDGLSVTNGGGLIGSGTGWRVAKVTDLNGDSKADVVWQHTDGSTAVWLMDGLNVINGSGLRGAGTGWRVREVGDFNADGKSDIVWQHTDGSSELWLMNGLSTISSGNLIGTGTGWSVKLIGDFNGDGKGDIVWQHANGSAAIWLMNGLNVVGGDGLLGPGSGWSVKQIGDFNGDGKSDVVWQKTDGSAAIWLMDGVNVINGGGLIGPTTGWSIRNSGDFNGDGKSDIVWQNVDGSAAIWFINGVSPNGGNGLLGPGTGWSPAP